MLKMPTIVPCACLIVLCAAPAFAQGANPSNGSVGGAISGYGTIVGPTAAENRPSAGAASNREAQERATSAPEFVEAVAGSDQYEVMAGEIAQRKAVSPQVREFARMMVQDHTATTAMLEDILARATPDLKPPMTLEPRKMAMIDDLMGAEGRNFDLHYVDQQVAAHQEALMLMESYADRGDVPELKAFAAATAPKIAMHLNMITQLQGQLRERG